MPVNLTKLAPICPKCKQPLEYLEMIEESIDTNAARYHFEKGSYVLIDTEILDSRPQRIMSVTCRRCEMDVEELVEDFFE